MDKTRLLPEGNAHLWLPLHQGFGPRTRRRTRRQNSNRAPWEGEIREWNVCLVGTRGNTAAGISQGVMKGQDGAGAQGQAPYKLTGHAPWAPATEGRHWSPAPRTWAALSVGTALQGKPPFCPRPLHTSTALNINVPQSNRGSPSARHAVSGCLQWEAGETDVSCPDRFWSSGACMFGGGGRGKQQEQTHQWPECVEVNRVLSQG